LRATSQRLGVVAASTKLPAGHKYFKFALPFLRGYCRHYAKPFVPVAQLGKGRKKFLYFI